jgi:hypothetical protein
MLRRDAASRRRAAAPNDVEYRPITTAALASAAAS